MPMQLSRRALLAGCATLAVAPNAAAAGRDAGDESDLAWLRLLVAAELLGADFYATAIRARKLRAKQLEDALAAERQHYALLAGLLANAGVAAATADDLDFAYPAGAFASGGRIARLAVALESTFLGAALGAVGSARSAGLALPLARIAASQAQHLAVWHELLGRYPLRPALPGALTIERASNLLDAYTA